jgi:hypothetical protein
MVAETTVAGLNIRHAPTVAEEVNGEPNFITTLAIGTVGRIKAGPVYADDYAWWDLDIPGFGSGHVAEGVDGVMWLDKTSAPTPATPAYAKPVPVEELVPFMDQAKLDANRWNLLPAVVPDAQTKGVRYILVADVVEATAETPRFQGPNSDAKVGPPIRVGERFIVAFLVIWEDGSEWYITPHWTWVQRTATKRIADAPVLA